MVQYDEFDNGGCSSGNFDRKCSSDTPKFIGLLVSRTLILKTSSLTDSSSNANHIMVEYDGVDDGGSYSNNFNREFTS